MDKPKLNFSLTLIATLVGFMIAIQFQTVKKPVERDTRDIWQLREALLKEKEFQSNLLSEIRSNEEKLSAYESKRKQSKEQALKDTLQELKIEAGLTDITGPGITLLIEPVIEDVQLGTSVNDSVSPELLKRLINELNMYEAKYVAIDGQRIINTTVIRDINGETKIDGHTLRGLPIEIKVGVDDMNTAEKLSNRMKVSKARDEFFTESLRLSVSASNPDITIPAYDNSIRVKYMDPIKEGGGS
ncbi:NgoFVII family restriction endonuclease [Bacillus sp. AFS076308]|uniref:DUF881 domain-containing protein n=1 Tax=unclassified Bacillus (in: firmicutes) TaxID=185979 RepID=UPI000BF55C65|nr:MULTISPECIES: DUF881 domain-containing protein [unclassified Bacillus (in: firmicutes)]PFO09966.1 NgoFVII family restriction endonuclease [Bacillus sp. AFS076308]PGV48849.1 NgoFVII family restriction endonuclease [Bacillus sp. AFS037270]